MIVILDVHRFSRSVFSQRNPFVQRIDADPLPAGKVVLEALRVYSTALMFGTAKSTASIFRNMEMALKYKKFCIPH
jgi:hypothetical protein